MVRSLAVLVGLVATSGCDRYYGPCNGRNELADGLVDTSGDVPMFDWEFGSAYAVSVYEVDGTESGREMWHVQCGGNNNGNNEQFEEQVCLSTPIVYGERPDSPFFDTVNFTRPKTLTPGTTYRVSLNTILEEDGPEPESKTPEWLDFLDRTAEHDDPHCGAGFSAELDFVAPGSDDIEEG